MSKLVDEDEVFKIRAEFIDRTINGIHSCYADLGRPAPDGIYELEQALDKMDSFAIGLLVSACANYWLKMNNVTAMQTDSETFQAMSCAMADIFVGEDRGNFRSVVFPAVKNDSGRKTVD